MIALEIIGGWLVVVMVGWHIALKYGRRGNWGP